MTDLRAPFPWFGGKSRVSSLVWQRFGDVRNFIDPFFGSGAVLLGRPGGAQGIETVNDRDCYLANFWRALQSDPECVAYYADWPVNEADQHARHLWLIRQVDFRERMLTDPDFYDVKIAGWWVWGQSMWIGSGWCQSAFTAEYNKRPHLGNAGTGVHRQRPHLGNAGRGEGLDDEDASVPISAMPEGASIASYLTGLADRLRRVRVCCGDWSRVCGPTPTVKQGLTGILLDPPYSGERTSDLYSVDSLDVAHAVREWALAWGDDPRMRIALCGYDDVEMPDTWDRVAWKAHGGYGSQGNGLGRENAAREVIFFSPHCLPAVQVQLTLWKNS